jgi:hypothetical protein
LNRKLSTRIRTHCVIFKTGGRQESCRRCVRLTHASASLFSIGYASLRAKAKIADLDEKLRSRLISPQRYDQICDQIMQRDLRAKASAGRRCFIQKLESLRECGQISEEEYRLRLEKLQPKRNKRRKKKLKPVSDPSLSSHMGKPAMFPPGARSDRIRGRTGWLARTST